MSKTEQRASPQPRQTPGSSATLGTTTSFGGNILAMASITLNTGANVTGRVLARTGAVTLDTNNVNAVICGGGPVPTLSQWGVSFLAAALLGLGYLRLRRRVQVG